MVEAVHTAKELGAETIGINAEDASRTELERLIELDPLRRFIPKRRIK